LAAPTSARPFGSSARAARREHAYRAIGPVWEAKRVWLVFVLVVCWTAYPDAFSSIFSTLTVPLFIAALGVIFRGTAYAVHAGTAREIERRAIDGVFSASSILTPFALGTAVGAIASGRVPVGNARGDLVTSWLHPTSMAIGVLAVANGAYVAAVYLAADARRAGNHSLTAARSRTRHRRDRIRRAHRGRARRGTRGRRLLEWPALAAIAASAAAGLLTLELVRRSHFGATRYGASVAVASIVSGWALAQRPELLPGLTVEEAAAGRETLIATVVGVALGGLVVLPSLALLFGLVLPGRFEAEVAPVERVPQEEPPSTRRVSLLGLAVALGGAGLALVLVLDGGAHLAAGIAALLAFVALASIAIVSALTSIATVNHDLTDDLN
jgi:cytochrome bd ubiquinol oxidase subunit II